MSSATPETTVHLAPGLDDPDTGHDYDGIREFDNRLPNWWLATLFGTIFFAFGYWFYFHVFEVPGTYASWKVEEDAAQAKAAAAAPVSEELLVGLSHNGEVMGKAAALWKQQCVACHLADGQGQIGPNLTDSAWIHGGTPSDIYKTITTGVPAKGMPQWGAILGEEKVRWLTGYVLTLKGKNLPGKAPEGTVVQ